MKKQILLIPFMLLHLYNAAQGPATIIGSKVPMPNITILATEPEQPIEGSLVTVYFRFNNPSLNAVTGWIGADINSGTGAPGKSTTDWPVKDLGIKQSIDGAIKVNTTNAGAGKKLRVYFYETQQTYPGNKIVKSAPKYEIGEKDINIAALLNFTLNDFTINHTRARSTDTDWGSLYAAVDDNGVMDPASVFMGNFDGGTHPFGGKDADQNALPNLETGPIALVPGINSNLYIAYTIYNGGGIDEHKKFLDGYAQATANPIMFHGPRPGTSAMFTAFKALNPFFNIIGACDGFVVLDTLTIQSNGIFSNTLNGNQSFSKRYNSEDYASQVGCGSTSDYTVTSVIQRLTKPTNYELFPQMVYTGIMSGRKVDISFSFGGASWQRIETIDESGKFIQVNDPAYGYVIDQQYNAPHQIDKPLLVILRGTLKVALYGSRNNTLNKLNNGPLAQATAIIQLVPGQNMITNTNILVNTNTGTTPGTLGATAPNGAKTTVTSTVPPVNHGASEVVRPHAIVTPANTPVSGPPASPVGPVSNGAATTRTATPGTQVIPGRTGAVVTRPVTTTVAKPDTAHRVILNRATIIHH